MTYRVILLPQVKAEMRRYVEKELAPYDPTGLRVAAFSERCAETLESLEEDEVVRIPAADYVGQRVYRVLVYEAVVWRYSVDPRTRTIHVFEMSQMNKSQGQCEMSI